MAKASMSRPPGWKTTRLIHRSGLSGIRQVRLDRREIRQGLVVSGVVVIAQIPEFDLTFASPQGNDGVGLFPSQGAAPFPRGEGDVGDLVVPVSKLAPLVHLRESSADESQSPVFIVSLRCRSLILLGELHRLQDMPELQGWLGFHGGLHGTLAGHRRISASILLGFFLRDQLAPAPCWPQATR